jgi:septin family protein
MLLYSHPSFSSLSPLDVEVMKRLGSRVNLIPVIAKADTLTPSYFAKFKQNVRNKPPPPYFIICCIKTNLPNFPLF